ncbi:MAG: hypothetical protein GF375_05380 [Candidatus Omnitrophica bacterium]|nr:hypothetical protein [Candidatus Omnitrophota bacterium]MBD3269417.1 hypothetical protein [Candidatus Omnitrophota bacterium]
MRVFGIDVGIRVCGYVICDIHNLDVRLIKEGEIKPNPKKHLPEKLSNIYEVSKKEILEHQPKAIITETLYSHHRHPTTLKILAQVRGVVALLAYQEKLNFFEFSTTKARKSFLGKGNADALQTKKVAENITGKKFKSVHTADAFSLVVAFSHARKVKDLFGAYK